MRVLFLTKYPRRGPSSRYRVLQYMPYLEREGISCDIQSLHTDGYLESVYAGRKVSPRYFLQRFLARAGRILKASGYSVVFLQKELLPYVPPIFELALRLGSMKVVYDIDDAIFFFYTNTRNPFVRLFLGNKIPQALRWSHLVLAGNTYLERYAARYNRRTVYFPTVVDPTRYRSTGLNDRGKDATGERPVIGWIGTPETAPFLLQKAAVLNRIYQVTPFKMLAIGSSDLYIPGLDVETVPWSEERETSELARCDIGIMPLPSTVWAKGKCGLKLLQYMASELPVVSSPEGGARDIITHGVTGYIAHSDDEWRHYLSILLNDRSLRRCLGQEGRRCIEEKFTLSLWAPRMAELLRMVGQGEDPGEVNW